MRLYSHSAQFRCVFFFSCTITIFFKLCFQNVSGSRWFHFPQWFDKIKWSQFNEAFASIRVDINWTCVQRALALIRTQPTYTSSKAFSMGSVRAGESAKLFWETSIKWGDRGALPQNISISSCLATYEIWDDNMLPDTWCIYFLAEMLRFWGGTLCAHVCHKFYPVAKLEGTLGSTATGRKNTAPCLNGFLFTG